MTTTDSRPYPPGHTRRRLYRSDDDRVIGGVCGGLAEYFDIDPIILRILAGVGVVFTAGWLLFAYVLAWLLLPLRGAGGIRPANRGRALLIAALVAIPLLGLTFGLVTTIVPSSPPPPIGPGDFHDYRGDSGPPLLLLLVPVGLAVAALFASRNRRGGDRWLPGGPSSASASAPAAATATDTLSAPAPATGDDLATGPAPEATAGESPGAAYDGPPGVPPWWAARAEQERPWPARREPATLSWLTVSFALIVAGIATLAHVAGVATFSTGAVLAAMLLVVAAGLLVGAWIGNPRGLMPIAIAVGALTVMASATPALTAGERYWQPASAGEVQSSYRLGAGQATLNLAALETAPGHEITARVGLGKLVVIVPAHLPVNVKARSGSGSVHLLGIAEDGGPNANVALSHVPPGFQGKSSENTIVLRLSVRLGSVEVRRAAA